MLKKFIVVILFSILFTIFIRWIFRHCEDIIYAKNNISLKQAYIYSRNNTRNNKKDNIFSYCWGLFSDYFFVLSAILFICSGSLFSYLYNNYVPEVSAIIGFSLIYLALVELIRNLCERLNFISTKRIYLSDLKHLKCWLYLGPAVIIYIFYIIAICIWGFHVL